jgi:purine-nucleoside phosphorylase
MDAFSTTADRVAAAATAIQRRWSCPTKIGVILGTGLGDLADQLTAPSVLPYREIPGFPCSTALAHKGQLVCGKLRNAPVVMLQGRCHCYEGYSLDELTLPVRVLASLGVETLVVTNAAGGLNPNYAAGDVMLIDDHIHLMGLTRTCSLDSATLGRITRPNTRLYDTQLASLAARTARRADFPLQQGVYVGVTGPSYETRAEYRAFRRIGGDCVGMSTVPEVLVAAGLGLRVLGLSTVTNVACPDAPNKVTAEEVVEIAAIARPRVGAIISALVAASG